MSETPTRILLVEDNPGDAGLLREALRDIASRPFDLVHVDSLGGALQRIGEEAFEAVLLDLSLPDAEGLDTVRRVLDVAPHVPIVVLTGLNDEAVALEALRVGAQDYLVKGQADGVFILRALRYAVERKQFLDRIRVLREIDQAISSTLKLNEILSALLEEIQLLFPFAAACIQKFNSARGLLEPIVFRNADDHDLPMADWRNGPFVAASVNDITEPITIRDPDTDLRVQDAQFLRRRGWVSVLGIPLRVKEKLWGLASFYLTQHRDFSVTELEFLAAVAARAAVAIRNAELYEDTLALAENLKRSNQVKDEFLSVMSHELRTPLNVVMNCAELLRGGIVGEINSTQANLLDRLLRQAKNQLSLVNSILHATQLESEQVEISLHLVDPAEFLENLKSHYEPLVDKDQVRLHWEAIHELPLLRLDRDKVRQILEGLINNAIKFTRAGTINIVVKLLDDGQQDAKRAYIQFEITDTGTGIPQESRSMIFERFYQVDATATRGHGGVGIGLYIVKRFTTLLGGEISVVSELGKGSTFTVTLPCQLITKEQRIASREHI